MTVFFWLILLVRFNKPNRTSFVIVILSMASTVLLPTLVYLKVSVPTVYSGVKFLATDMLRLDSPMSWVLTAALMIRFTSHSLVNPHIRTIYRQIKEPRRGLSFSLAPLIWAFLPLSIGTLSFVAKAEAVWPVFADEVSILIVSHFGGQLGIVLVYGHADLDLAGNDGTLPFRRNRSGAGYRFADAGADHLGVGVRRTAFPAPDDSRYDARFCLDLGSGRTGCPVGQGAERNQRAFDGSDRTWHGDLLYDSCKLGSWHHHRLCRLV
ncbi:UNVERIFIED_CONTAM: tryptophan-rich sensory protein [Brevibacillus sp. OAP136]